MFAKLVSMFVYLNEVPPGAGGQTLFPYHHRSAEAHAIEVDAVRQSSLHGSAEGAAATQMALECKPGLAVEPKLGAAVLWYNHRRDGSLDPLATHAGCVVQAPLLVVESDSEFGSASSSRDGVDHHRDDAGPSSSVEKWGCNVWIIASAEHRRQDDAA